MKENLLTGKAKTLKLPDKVKRQIYPESVVAIAIVEPAKHSGRAIIDDQETVPTRY